MGMFASRTVYCFSTGGEAAHILRSFEDTIRFVMPDGSTAQVYYRIQPDGEGVLVCQRADEPQMFSSETNSGLQVRELANGDK